MEVSDTDAPGEGESRLPLAGCGILLSSGDAFDSLLFIIDLLFSIKWSCGVDSEFTSSIASSSIISSLRAESRFNEA